MKTHLLALRCAAQPKRPSLRPQGSLTRSLPRRPPAALDPAASTAARSPIHRQATKTCRGPWAHRTAIPPSGAAPTNKITSRCPCRQVQSGTPREERDPRETYEQPAPGWPRSPSVDSDARSRSNNPSCGNQPAHIRLDRASLNTPNRKDQAARKQGRSPTPSQAAGQPMPNLTKRTTYQVSDRLVGPFISRP
jgi:hypothetical protein